VANELEERQKQFYESKKGILQRLVEGLGMEYYFPDDSYTLEGKKICKRNFERDPLYELEVKEFSKEVQEKVTEIIAGAMKDRPYGTIEILARSTLRNIRGY
jgi:hypothetical protein